MIVDRPRLLNPSIRQNPSTITFTTLLLHSANNLRRFRPSEWRKLVAIPNFSFIQLRALHSRLIESEASRSVAVSRLRSIGSVQEEPKCAKSVCNKLRFIFERLTRSPRTVEENCALCMQTMTQDNSHAPLYVTLGDRYVAIFVALLTLRSR